MADFATHLIQADHNTEVAKKLSKEPPFHDWAVTASFYAAIHLFEAWLFHRPEKHAETSIPRDANGRMEVSVHSWRERLIERNLSKAHFQAFRLLRDSSETARYLTLYRMGSSGSPSWISMGAWDYLKPSDVKDMVEEDLRDLREGLKTDLAEFLYKLDLERRLGASFLMFFDKLISDYPNKDSFLTTPVKTLKSRYGEAVMKALTEGAAAIGLAFGGE